MSFLKEIFIFTNLQPNIPNIYADELRIKQILISLIHQSIENSPKNSEISITSNTCLQNNGSSLFEITIIDQRFGLDEQDTRNEFLENAQPVQKCPCKYSQILPQNFHDDALSIKLIFFH